MLTMKNLKKSFATVLAAMVMSLPVAGQALAAPVELPAAPQQLEMQYHNGGHRQERVQHPVNHKAHPVNNHKVRPAGTYHKPAPHHHPAPQRETYRRDGHHHSATGNFVTGAIVGAIIGAVIANNSNY